MAQGLATKARILSVARELFGTQGFAATTTEAIVRAAGVTRGALYHHFRDKVDLLQAVVEEVEQEVSERMRDAVASVGRDPRQAAIVPWEAVLDTALDPVLTRIRVLEAPAVLPWDVWHGIQSRNALGNIEGLLEALKGAGVMDPDTPRSLAILLMGAAAEAVAVIGNADDTAATRAEMGRAAQWLTQRLLTSPD